MMTITLLSEKERNQFRFIVLFSSSPFSFREFKIFNIHIENEINSTLAIYKGLFEAIFSFVGLRKLLEMLLIISRVDKSKISNELLEIYKWLQNLEDRVLLLEEKQGYSGEAPPMKLHRRCRNEKKRSFSSNVMYG